MIKLILASGNAHKVQEIRDMLQGMPLEVISMKEAGVNPEIDENGTTFEENSLIKSRTIWEALPEKAYVLADDSGLEVAALGGEPGVYSARYMGEDTSYSIKNQAIIDRLAGKEGAERAADFRCVMSLVCPDGREYVCEGRIDGIIAKKPGGENGFGYDPIFFLPERGLTTAELSPEEKNAVSHRGRALEQVKQVLEREFAR